MPFPPHGFDKSLVVDVLEMTQLYVRRRQIGSVFKELKSYYRLGELSARKVPVVEALPLLIIMTFLRPCRRVSQSRWASLFDTDSVHALN